jgi:2-polyprenyl-3-methyl-5-hydroxy-6-metoxy-1,4-benzoquinol methylase
MNEKELLESVVPTYVTSQMSSQDRYAKGLAVRTFKPFMRLCGKGLEFGCLDGYMTNLIRPLVSELTVVDGSLSFIEMARRRVGSEVNFVHSLFEDFDSSEKYDYVFACYVLEHVVDPVGFLRMAARHLAPDGLLFVVVPNARAISRQLARHMGLLDDLFALTENDLAHGHRRVYDRMSLDRDVQRASLVQVARGGILLKILADFQMDKLIDSRVLGETQLDGLYHLGFEYPDLCGSLFSVCRIAE